jgi:hypothetical protein
MYILLCLYLGGRFGTRNNYCTVALKKQLLYSHRDTCVQQVQLLLGSRQPLFDGTETNVGPV